MKFITTALSNVQPNPYRGLDAKFNTAAGYYEQSRIEALKESIKETGFWANIIAREVDGKLQIAYGHHRIAAALQVLGPDYEHTFPVSDIPDFMMLQIMAAENSEDWGFTTQHANLTYVQARTMLDEFCDAYSNSNRAFNAKGEVHGITGKQAKQWFGNAGNFTKSKTDGVGFKLVAKFINTMKAHQVRAAAEIAPKSKKQIAAAKAKVEQAQKEVKRQQAALKKAQAAADKATTEVELAEAEALEKAVKAEAQKAQQIQMKDDAYLRAIGAWNPKAGELFSNPHHARTFREMALFYRMEKAEQMHLAKKLIKALGPELTANNIREYIHTSRPKSKAPKDLCPAVLADHMKQISDALHRLAGLTNSLEAQMKAMGMKKMPLTETQSKNMVSAFNAWHQLSWLAGNTVPPVLVGEGVDAPRKASGSGTNATMTDLLFGEPMYMDDLVKAGLFNLDDDINEYDIINQTEKLLSVVPLLAHAS